MKLTPEEKVRKKFKAIASSLGERARRLWVGAEADAHGRGGIALVARATGMAISTIGKGRDESRLEATLPLGRDRRPGAGRKPLEEKDPGLLPLLESLVNPSSRGDPESPLRWTTKSLRLLEKELRAQNHAASAAKIAELLHAAGYSLQANAKTKEGEAHPDRNAQFERINATAEDFLSRGQPVISVDAKKKEVVGERAMAGREWHPKKTPIEVATHDFVQKGEPVAIPYGVYDVGKNLGYVNVGTDHNTPTFAANSIEKWWRRLGSGLYPNATEVFVTADAGGSNAFRSHVFKSALQGIADRTRLAIHVSHFPPGTSKWNKIEHRLFSFITLNWRGRPLVSYELIIALIAATTTSKGLKVSAELDHEEYPTGISVSKHRRSNFSLTAAAFHGEWNYVLHPRSDAQRAVDHQAPALRRNGPHAARNTYWKEKIRQQLQSGLNARAFCAQEKLNYWTFAAARRRLVGKIRKLRTPEEILNYWTVAAVRRRLEIRKLRSPEK